MNPQSSTPSTSTIEPGNLPQPVYPAVANWASAHPVAERLYQIAALTAGIFLLATML